MVSKSRSPWLMALFFALCLCVFVAQSHAQFLGYTAPQTVGPITCLNAVSAPATSSATPGAASFIPNLGQSVHYITYTTSGGVSLLEIQLDGSSNGTNWIRISDTATSQGSGALFAPVYLPFIRCNLVQFSGAGTLTAVYTGTSVTAGPPVGIFNTSGIFTKTLALSAPAGTSDNFLVQLPRGNTGGILYFSYTNGAGPSGSNFVVQSGPDSASLVTIATLNIPSTVPVFQAIRVPAIPSNVVAVFYNAGGASGASYDLYYAFDTVGSFSTEITTEPNLEPLFVCPSQANISLSAAGNTEIIAAITGRTIRVCHLSIAFAATVDLSLHRGTGVDCATGDTAITGTYQDVLTTALDFSSFGALRGTSSSALCVNLGTAVTGGGVITYAQF